MSKDHVELSGYHEPLGRADLEEIVHPQISRAIMLGFHTEVYPNLTEKEAEFQYRDDCMLSSDAVQPAEYAGYFDVVLLIEPRISLTKKHELAGRIKELNLDPVARKWTISQVTEWVGRAIDLTEHPTDMPYLIFTHSGKKYRPYDLTKPLVFFKSFEIGCPQLEVTDLFLQKPGFFDRRAIEAVGSRFSSNLATNISVFSETPVICYATSTNSYPDYLTATRGKYLVELGVKGRG